jgi:hypothetical protein
MTITISTGNDAFQPDPKPEIIRILRLYIEALEKDTRPGIPTGKIFDINGNSVGKVYGD